MLNKTRRRARLGVFCSLAITSLVLVTLAACKRHESTSDEPLKIPKVFVTNYPLEYFAKSILGRAAEVRLPAPADVDPAFWNPEPEMIEQYQKADLILINGAGYEKWVERSSLPESKIVDTSLMFKDQLLKLPEAIVHKHGPEGEHAHEGLASHTWLDPHQARLQAESVRDAVLKLAPEFAPGIQPNWQTLDEVLMDLEDRLHSLAIAHPDRPMWASHPVYDYLGRACGWKLKSVHWEPDEIPSEEEWKKFAELFAQHQSSWMIWEAPPNDETKRRLLDEFHIQCIVFYPCGNRPEGSDYVTVMRENVKNLERVLSK